MFLVLVGCGIDDIPMRKFGDKDLAVAYAMSLKEAEVQKVAREVFNRDVSVFHAIGIVTFDMSGRAAKWEVLRDLDHDENF